MQYAAVIFINTVHSDVIELSRTRSLTLSLSSNQWFSAPSQHQQHPHLLGAYEECIVSTLTSDPLTQKLWGRGSATGDLTNPPGDCDADSLPFENQCSKLPC